MFVSFSDILWDPWGCRSCDPLQLVQLPYGGGSPLWFALVTPVFEAPTKEMRAVLPQAVPFKSMIHNSCQGGSLVASILTGERALCMCVCGAGFILEAFTTLFLYMPWTAETWSRKGSSVNTSA